MVVLSQCARDVPAVLSSHLLFRVLAQCFILGFTPYSFSHNGSDTPDDNLNSLMIIIDK